MMVSHDADPIKTSWLETTPTLHISTLFRASSISSLRESTLAAIAWLVDLVVWYHLKKPRSSVSVKHKIRCAD